MADLDYVPLIGRFGLTVGDGNDPDLNPDTVWCDEGTVELIPLNTYTKVDSSIPWTAGHSVIATTINDQGCITWNATPVVMMVDMASTKVNPQVSPGKATHKVQFKGVRARGALVEFAPANVRISADTMIPLTTEAAAVYGLPVGTMVCDLEKLMPVPTSGGTAIVVGPQGKGIATLDVEGADLVYELTDGTTGNAGTLPVGPGGTPTGIALAINDATGPAGVAVAAKIATDTWQIVCPTDGVTGATAAINTQLLAAQALGVKRVSLPRAGTILLDGTVWLPDSIALDATGANLLCKAGAAFYPVRPLSMKTALFAPGVPAAAVASTGGTLAAGSYLYQVSAVTATGETMASVPVGLGGIYSSSPVVNTTGTTSKITLTWNAPTVPAGGPAITGYRIFGRGKATRPQLLGTTDASTRTFVDDGSLSPQTGVFVPPQNTTIATSTSFDVTGGTWDINGGNRPCDFDWVTNGKYAGMGFDPHRVKNVHIGDGGMKIINARKWAVAPVGCEDVQIGKILYDTLADGVHILGPSKRVLIDRQTGYTNDDMVAFSTLEWPTYAASEGDIDYVEVQPIHARGSYAIVRVLGGVGTKFGKLLFRGLHGTTTTDPARANDNQDSPGRAGTEIDEITFENVDYVKTSTTNASLVQLGAFKIGKATVSGMTVNSASYAGVTIADTGTIGEFILRNASVKEGLNGSSLLLTSGSKTIKKLTVDNIAHRDNTATGGNLLSITGVTINDLQARNLHFEQAAGSNAIYVYGTTSILAGSIDGAYIKTANALLTLDASTVAALEWRLSNVRGDTVQALVKSRTATTVHFAATAASVSAGVFYAIGSGSETQMVYGDFRVTSGQGIKKDSSATIYAHGLGVHADVAVLARRAGDSAYNTNAALSCGAGPVICDGTSWKHLFTGATY